MLAKWWRKVAVGAGAAPGAEPRDPVWDAFIDAAREADDIPEIELLPVVDSRLEPTVDIIPRIERALIDLALAAERLDGRIDVIERKLEVTDDHVRLVAGGADATRSEVAALREATYRVQDQLSATTDATNALREELVGVRADREMDRETVAELHGALRAARLSAERARLRGARPAPPTRVAPIPSGDVDGTDPSVPIALLPDDLD